MVVPAQAKLRRVGLERVATPRGAVTLGAECGLGATPGAGLTGIGVVVSFDGGRMLDTSPVSAQAKLSIKCQRCVFDGEGLSRLFDVQGGSVSVTGATLRNGSATTGGAMRVSKGGVASLADVTIEDCEARGGNRTNTTGLARGVEVRGGAVDVEAATLLMRDTIMVRWIRQCPPQLRCRISHRIPPSISTPITCPSPPAFTPNAPLLSVSLALRLPGLQ